MFDREKYRSRRISITPQILSRWCRLPPSISLPFNTHNRPSSPSFSSRRTASISPINFLSPTASNNSFPVSSQHSRDSHWRCGARSAAARRLSTKQSVVVPPSCVVRETPTTVIRSKTNRVREVTLEFWGFTTSEVGANSLMLGWIRVDVELNKDFNYSSGNGMARGRPARGKKGA
ncbi:hypothetical protein E5676_scaffold1567G00150 [Cucumis melo var. makuwa]|uniref:Uncharacterized protein n=1 Tax=Cucumis melo var. makuwa TaxID=1194695 RepID=A0A5D3DRW3_CUCMM|nr:hypothetical protein E5676_scaffold1567G00150 [Cucumis melo var. makuwa]